MGGLKLNSTVNKIVFNEQNNRAIGVVLANSKVIKAKKEVIVSAGSFNSSEICEAVLVIRQNSRNLG